jgi:hypothetical protein
MPKTRPEVGKSAQGRLDERIVLLPSFEGHFPDSRIFVHMDHAHIANHPHKPLSPEPLRRGRARRVLATWYQMKMQRRFFFFISAAI